MKGGRQQVGEEHVQGLATGQVDQAGCLWCDGCPHAAAVSMPRDSHRIPYHVPNLANNSGPQGRPLDLNRQLLHAQGAVAGCCMRPAESGRLR